MVAAQDQARPESSSYLQDILDSPEHPDLHRLTAMVEHIFQVPVAYMALLGYTDEVVLRIGSGTEYAPYLKKIHLDHWIDQPQQVLDPARDLPPGTDLGPLQFAASAPLRASSGVRLGVLAIADVVPRPGFSRQDARTLSDLASVLAGKMELRMIASLALESELSLRETERRFRGIANSAPVLLIYSGADGNCLFVNQTWLNFSGRELEQELYDGWTDLIHPEYRESVVEGYWRAFQNRQAFATEAPFRRHDGQYRWVLARGAPRFRHDGSFAGYVGCLLDITDDHNTLAALRRQSQFTTAVAQAARAFYLVLDPQGRIQEVSPPCRKLAAQSSRPMVGELVWEACNAAACGGPAVRDAIEQAAANRATAETETSGFRWTLTPIEAEGGELHAIVATVFRTSPDEPGCACGGDCPA